MIEIVETLIVGAGPTGLGAAWQLSSRGEASWPTCEVESAPGDLASSVVDEHGYLGSREARPVQLRSPFQRSNRWPPRTRRLDIPGTQRLGLDARCFRSVSPFQLNLCDLLPADKWESVA